MAWNRTQGGTFGDISGTTFGSMSVTFGSALTNPSIIIVFATYDSTVGFPDVSNVTDTAGNSYSRILQFNDSTAGAGFEVWWAINTHTTASNQVTVHFTTASGFITQCIDEYTGGGTSPAADQNGTQAVTTASPGPYLSPSETPTQNGELILGFLLTDGTAEANPLTANSPFTLGSSTSSVGSFGTEWFAQTTAAAIQASFNGTITAGPRNVVSVVTIKATASGPPFPPLFPEKTGRNTLLRM